MVNNKGLRLVAPTQIKVEARAITKMEEVLAVKEQQLEELERTRRIWEGTPLLRPLSQMVSQVRADLMTDIIKIRTEIIKLRIEM